MQKEVGDDGSDNSKTKVETTEDIILAYLS